MTSMTSQAAYMALRKDADDDSTLVGSRIIGSDDRSMEYSSIGESASEEGGGDDDSSAASSLFQNDRYFQEPLPDWSYYNEERGRQFAKTMLLKNSSAAAKAASKKKKGGLLHRAVRAFRRRTRQQQQQLKSDTRLLGQCSTLEDDDFSDGEITFDQEQAQPWQHQGETPPFSSLPNLQQEPSQRDLDCISDCTNDATFENTTRIEVWLPSDMEEDDDDDAVTNIMSPPSEAVASLQHVQIQMSVWKNRRDTEQYCPDGLFLRTSAQEVVDKLQLGDAGQSALQALNEATDAAAKAFDASKIAPSMSTTIDNTNVIPTLVTIAGYDVPDYTTYVRSAVSSFGKNVLQLSDDLCALLEQRMVAKTLAASSKLRLLPFAVELYALERLMANPIVAADEASI